MRRTLVGSPLVLLLTASLLVPSTGPAIGVSRNRTPPGIGTPRCTHGAKGRTACWLVESTRGTVPGPSQAANVQ